MMSLPRLAVSTDPCRPLSPSSGRLTEILQSDLRLEVPNVSSKVAQRKPRYVGSE